MAWCTASEAAKSAIDANIAVTIGADVLAGYGTVSEQAAWCERQRVPGVSGEERAAAA